LSPAEFQALPRLPVSVILEDLRSAFNVGSIIRTADCARIEKVVFCGYTAHPPNKKLEKTSLGALPYAKWEHRADALEAVDGMKEAGIPVAALELTDRSRWIWDFTFPLPMALVLGNEALGVSQEVLRRSDFIIEIPMLGYKNSINVAVAFGICVYEIQRQYWKDIRRENQIPLRSLKSKKETG
ncbi:RNA methyltransferase, partial [bacterium]|nr:RNA methyltransferase [bacterium]